MAVRYNKLFKKLVDLKMSNGELIEKAGFSGNIITRMKKDEYIFLESVEKICIALNCSIDDILEFIPDRKWEILGK